MSTSLQKREMPYVRLGNSGLKVSRIILGCMSYGTPEWESWILGEDESLKMIKAAYDAGINTFDTANAYSNGVSEVVLGKAIKEFNLPRDEIVVMTKVYFPVPESPAIYLIRSGLAPDEYGFVNRHGLSRKHIFDSVKASLERLQLDYIDVLQCHRFDADTPIAETMQALHDIVQAGYVRYIGMSSCWAWQFHMMQSTKKSAMMPTLKHFGVGSIPWSPLARGVLARPASAEAKTQRSEADRTVSRYATTEADGTTVDRVEEIAKKRNISMAQVALAWILSKDVVTAPIVGTGSLERLNDTIKSVHVKLTDDEIRYMEEPYRPKNIIGHA
ncbi:hypothetical protein AX14_006684 [Amanita brunnescens Koide BX004]|nr:hypothetical protein AX14_006684 [Amanita brunnescens Koide BX004]